MITYNLSCIYFVKALKSNAIKIGIAKNPQIRIANLRNSTPEELEVLGVLPNTRKLDEAKIHKKFSKDRLKGEWFLPSVKLEKFIKNNCISLSEWSKSYDKQETSEPFVEIKLEETLKKLILDKKLTVRELSRRTGIPQSTLNVYTLGRPPGKPEHLIILAKYFGCSIEYLLTGNRITL